MPVVVPLMRKLKFLQIVACLLLASVCWPDCLGPASIVAQEAAIVEAKTITLDQIMADPEWLGRPAENAYWSDDGTSVYYSRKRAGEAARDWYQSDLDGNLIRVVQDEDRGRMDSQDGNLSPDRKRKVWQRAGDLSLKDLLTGKIRQLTRTQARESAPRFTADGRGIMFQRDSSVFVRNLKSGLEAELVVLRAEDDPAEARDKKREGYLPQQQQDLFEYLRKTREEEDAAREESERQQAADSTRTPLPWYLGGSHSIDAIEVAPNSRWCLVSMSSKQAKRGDADKMPEFVHESGYVNSRDVRPLVGTGKAVSDKLLLLDLKNRVKHELDFSVLSGLDEDPLADVREEAEKWRKERAAKAGSESEDKEEGSDEPAEKQDPKVERAVSVGSITWNDLGDQVAVQFFSADNKDRWIATVDLKSGKLDARMHRRDPAWINWRVGEVEWLADDQTLRYVSEESGYAHLYLLHVPSNSTRQLTSGEFVVRDVQAGSDGKHLYYKANAFHPGIYEIYRVNIQSGEIEQLTNLGGMNDYLISPDESQLLITHSTAMSPAELWVQPVGDREAAKQITLTVSTEFSNLPWIEPQFITVPSRAGNPIHARLYLPPGHDPSKTYPATIFIHGAGYLQNAHQGWSGYFREFMFHSLLAHRGFVVIDMDYRASEGYGRDWRTAIYRRMGWPELEDLKDGKDWLVENQGVDAKRVGLYGGSYGGFLTLMALFRQPGEYACGAALRPVTDWAHYNHGYTSNILNTPDLDPEAYAVSSPIEFAEGLDDPLLMCHGMVDDNVFFKDTARLAQRLIELRKKDWELALYPVEPHGFVQPSSWYDEYRRILELLERHTNSSE